MKAILNLDQQADIDTCPEEYLRKLEFATDSNGKVIHIYPKGTEFEGSHALHLVRTGQASPADDECRIACGMTEAQVAVNNRKYAAAAAGIKGEKDMALFMARAIEGYAPDSTDEAPVYIPGENWDKWQAAQKAAADKSPI